MKIKHSSQILTTAHIFWRSNYFRQKYLEIASCAVSLFNNISIMLYCNPPNSCIALLRRRPSLASWCLLLCRCPQEKVTKVKGHSGKAISASDDHLIPWWTSPKAHNCDSWQLINIQVNDHICPNDDGIDDDNPELNIFIHWWWW